ncbi:hypothetical protein PP707_05545 [Acetobacter pasteurianus]|nr:hypothetical protein [Acetobacter pasteurianus]
MPLKGLHRTAQTDESYSLIRQREREKRKEIPLKRLCHIKETAIVIRNIKHQQQQQTEANGKGIKKIKKKIKSKNKKIKIFFISFNHVTCDSFLYDV